MNYKDFIRIIPDFPKAGIIFKDITPLIKDGATLKKAVKEMAAKFTGQSIELIAGPEARGFLIGMAVIIIH